MTRMERNRRRQGIIVYIVLCAAVLLLAAAIVLKKPFEKKEIIRLPYEPPYEVFTQSAYNAVNFATPEYYREDVPIDRYQQETLYNAAKEWNVPYELALAVCFCETEYQNLVTVVPHEDGTTRTYYGMMAVQGESAGSYMEKCGVEWLNSEEDRLRVGCCILGEHIANYGITRGLMAYNSGTSTAQSQWTVGVEQTAYTIAVLNKMEELME